MCLDTINVRHLCFMQLGIELLFYFEMNDILKCVYLAESVYQDIEFNIVFNSCLE